MINDSLISGIICEFNPLHTGHRLILQKMKAEGPVVCAMSGNFVQRGEPAIIDKWARAELALQNGADLVLELPVSFSVAGAERFALGGVSVLAALGCVQNLWFGSESGDISALGEIAQALDSPDFRQALKQALCGGTTFAVAREAAVAQMLGPRYSGQLRHSNNILAVEYLRALHCTGAAMTPRTLTRRGAAHDSPTQGCFMSAMEIRRQILLGQLPAEALPESTLAKLKRLEASGAAPASLARLEIAVLAKLRTMTPEDFCALPDISEGLENRLYKAARTAGSLADFYVAAKSKRYSHARIRRLALCAFLDLSLLPLTYVRVLAMNSTGQKLLKSACPTLPLVGKSSDIHSLTDNAHRQLAQESRADDLYALSLPTPQPCGQNYTRKMIKC